MHEQCSTYPRCRTYYALSRIGDFSYRLALDTASADLWAVSSACTLSTCKPLPRYPLSYGSPTFVSVNGNSSQFSLSFADSTGAFPSFYVDLNSDDSCVLFSSLYTPTPEGASGFIARESVTIGNLTVANQAIGKCQWLSHPAPSALRRYGGDILGGTILGHCFHDVLCDIPCP